MGKSGRGRAGARRRGRRRGGATAPALDEGRLVLLDLERREIGLDLVRHLFDLHAGEDGAEAAGEQADGGERAEVLADDVVPQEVRAGAGAAGAADADPVARTDTRRMFM